MKDRFEISQWAEEVFTNNQYKSIEGLSDVMKSIEDKLDAILSVKLFIKNNGTRFQYNIETKKYITNIATIQGIDLNLRQYDKAHERRTLCSPYSDPGYSIFTHLLCAYFEIFKKRPVVHFGEMDIEERKKDRNWRGDNPVLDKIDGIRWDGSMYDYLFYWEKFATDEQWIQRVVSSSEPKERSKPWFGIQWDTVILHDTDYQYTPWAIHDILFEKDLLLLYLQAIIDVNFSTGWSINIVNMKKIYEMIYYVLENEEIRKRGKDDNGIFKKIWSETLK